MILYIPLKKELKKENYEFQKLNFGTIIDKGVLQTSNQTHWSKCQVFILLKV